MAIGFDKMSEMGRGGRSRGRVGTSSTPRSCRPHFALRAQRRMHDHGTRPEHFAADRREELEPRRPQPPQPPPARSHGDGGRGARAHG